MIAKIRPLLSLQSTHTQTHNPFTACTHQWKFSTRWQWEVVVGRRAGIFYNAMTLTGRGARSVVFLLLLVAAGRSGRRGGCWATERASHLRQQDARRYGLSLLSRSLLLSSLCAFYYAARKTAQAVWVRKWSCVADERARGRKRVLTTHLVNN